MDRLPILYDVQVGTGVISRRRVLAFGVGGAALLLCGGGLSWLRLGYSLPVGDVAIALSVKQLAVVRAVVEALLPATQDLPSGVELGVHQRIDEELWAAPDEVRADLALALELIEHLPPVHGFSGRLTRLSVAQREAFLLGCLRSELTPVVQAVVALKQMSHLFYYCEDHTWSAIGYDGPWVQQPRPPASAVRYAELLASRRSP